MYDFKYLQPLDLAESVKVLRTDLDAKVLAGGMTFIPVLKQRLNKPNVIVDLCRLGIVGIKSEGDSLTIGAMTPHFMVAASKEVQQHIPAVAYLANNIGDRQVRYRGTIGGSLANNDPAACYPSAVLATNAKIRTDRRIIAADDYFRGMFTTALEQDEIIVEVQFPRVQTAAYMKFGNPASRYAMVGVFVAKSLDGVRVAVTGSGQNGVFRHLPYEEALNRSFSVESLKGVHTDRDIMSNDIHADCDYRAHLVDVMVKRAVAKAMQESS